MAKTTKHRLERKSATALIVESLRQRIRDHEFPESEVIRQEPLAEEYGVSIAPVREALARLEAEGLLTLLRHKGYIVRTLTIDDIRQLYEIRALIETELLRFAIQNMDEETLSEAEDLEAKMKKIAKTGRQTSDWTQLNWHFHTVLYAAARKQQYWNIANNIYANIDRYVHMQLSISHSVVVPRSVKEHDMLLEYCRDHRVEEACRLLRKHITDAADDLIAFLENQRSQ